MPPLFKPVFLGLLREAYLAEQAFVHGLDASERRAIGTPDRWSAKDHVAAMKGLSLYNLACFQATHAQVEKAAASLAQALAIYPRPSLNEFSLSDPT
jgi:hypothetical protein